MRSETTPAFWKEYSKLDPSLKASARKAYSIWHNNPFHPSLRFRCIDAQNNIWSARISKSHRAVCVFEDDTAIWFWIGKHDDYEDFYG
jgi:hypothetical protein